MTIVKLFPADIYNQKTIQQGHPPDWTTEKAVNTTWWFSAAG